MAIVNGSAAPVPAVAVAPAADAAQSRMLIIPTRMADVIPRELQPRAHDSGAGSGSPPPRAVPSPAQAAVARFATSAPEAGHDTREIYVVRRANGTPTARV